MKSLLAALALCFWLGGDKAPGVEQTVKGKLSLLEQQDPKVWAIDEFTFVPLRPIRVEVPGKGEKLLWYLSYKVIDRGDHPPRLFVPDFRLVDNKGRVYRDTMNPKAQRLIQQRENPVQPLENSISIVGELQPSQEEGISKPKYGVAIFEDVDPRFTAFDILVMGLSNAVEMETVEGKRVPKMIQDPVTGEERAAHKTLQLKFSRPGDEFLQNEREVKYLGQEWIYRPRGESRANPTEPKTKEPAANGT